MMIVVTNRLVGRNITNIFRQEIFQAPQGYFSTTIKILKTRSSSSQHWLQRQQTDPYVKKARFESYRCRSAFKLLEMDDKLGLLLPGMTVLDCGAAPGSWSQVAVKKVNSNGTDSQLAQGRVVSVDLNYMQNLPGAAVFSQSDITKLSTQKKILQHLNGELADLILSDMAPNASGVKSLDQEIIVDLCLSVLTFATVILKEGGNLLCKIWQGADQHKLQCELAARFNSVKVVKPLASRTDSAEVFLLGRGFNDKGILPTNR